MPTFGNTTFNAVGGGELEYKARGGYFYNSQYGTATSITVYIRATATHKTRCALYRAEDQTRGTFVAETEEKTITSTTFLSTQFNFQSTVTLSPGYYFIVANSEITTGEAYIGITASAADEIRAINLSSYEFPTGANNFSVVFPAYIANIYCTYTLRTCTAYTTQAQCEANGCYWYNGSCNATPYWSRDVFVSGYLSRFQKRQIVGYFPHSGDLRSVMVNASGHLFTDVEIDVSSGLNVVVQSGLHVLISGLPVTISGDHVYVESGVWIAGMSFSGLDIQVNISGDPVIISGQPVIISGQPVTISGDHVFVESGAFVTTQPGIQVSGAVIVSGDTNLYAFDGTSGFASGIWRPIAICGSGEIIICSGAHVITQPGIQVSGLVDAEVLSGQIHILSGIITVESGLHVWISGQHVFQESGAYVICESGMYAIAEITTPTDILIGTYVDTTNTNPMPVDDKSGGTPLRSGAIISVVVKALSTNSGDIYVGGYVINEAPLSGYGLLLEPGEVVNIDINQMGKVHVFAEQSGDRVTYLANEGTIHD